MNNFVQAGTDRLLVAVTIAGPSLLLVLYKVALYELAVSAPKTAEQRWLCVPEGCR